MSTIAELERDLAEAEVDYADADRHLGEYLDMVEDYPSAGDACRYEELYSEREYLRDDLNWYRGRLEKARKAASTG